MGTNIRLTISPENPNTAYVALPDYPDAQATGIVKRTVSLDDLIEPFVGPRIYVDFDKEDKLIGIEILA